MKRYIPTFIFYIVSFIVIYLLSKVSPNQQDGGLGVGSVAILLLVVIAFLMMGINLYKGFSKDKGNFVLAAIHLSILLVIIFNLFL